jgi:hypothetical protein
VEKVRFSSLRGVAEGRRFDMTLTSTGRPLGLTPLLFQAGNPPRLSMSNCLYHRSMHEAREGVCVLTRYQQVGVMIQKAHVEEFDVKDPHVRDRLSPSMTRCFGWDLPSPVFATYS